MVDIVNSYHDQLKDISLMKDAYRLFLLHLYRSLNLLIAFVLFGFVVVVARSVVFHVGLVKALLEVSLSSFQLSPSFWPS
jgi:hypothetical protein